MQKTMYNQKTIEVLKERFGYSADYIRKSLRGDRTGIIPDKIKSEYETITRQLDQVVVEFKNQSI